MLSVFVFILGTALGSFLNVVIHRLPEGESPLSGRSKCPDCGSTILFYDNIPIVSFLLLRARCRHCGGRISVQYPLVELLCGVILVVNFRLFEDTIIFLHSSSFLLLLLPMAIIDAKHYLLPNELTIGGFALGILFSIIGGPISFKHSIIGSVIGGGFLLAVSMIGSAVMKKEVMGEGDVKMMAMIGAYLGWKSVFLTIFLGSFLGTLIFGPISLRRKIMVPFGVFLAVGGFVSLYFQNLILDLYLSLFW